MRSDLTLFIQPLLNLYILTYALRLGMQWVRADYRSPIVQFVLSVTNPLVAPLQKRIPPVYKIDTATLLVYLILSGAAVTLLTSLECFLMPDFASLAALGLIYAAKLLINVYWFVILAFVILSWVVQGNYNPTLSMLYASLREISQPVMAPLQRVIPPIGGLDVSPIIVLIGLPALSEMLMRQGFRLVAGFNCSGAIL